MKKICASLLLFSLVLPSMSQAGRLPLPPQDGGCPDCYAFLTGVVGHKASKTFTVALEAGHSYEVRLVPLSGNPNLRTTVEAPDGIATPICQPALPRLYPESCRVKAYADTYHAITVTGASPNKSQFTVQVIAHPDFDW